MAKRTAEGEPIIIKKYANRRLYNTDTSSYITLDDLAKMVRENVDFHVLDAKSGELLFHKNLGGQIVMAPVTYMVDGVQYVSIISGNSLFTFALKG